MRRSLLWTAFWIVLVAAVAGLAWRPVLGGYFFADDYIGLYALADHGPWPFVVEPHGGHLLLLRNTAFWLCWLAFGADPVGWFASAVVTHVLNAILLYFVLARAARSAALAGAIAALWAAAPAHEGTLAWYAVYGHALATTFVLLLLLDVLRCRDRETAPTAARAALWAVLLLAAGVSYGVGLGVAAAAPVALPLLVPAMRRDRRALAIVALVPVVLAGVWLATAQPSAGIHAPTDSPMKSFVAPRETVTLLGLFGSYGLGDLVLGPWGRWVGAPGPTTFAVGAAAAALLVLVLLRTRDAALLAALVLALAAYGSIAAARAGLFVSIKVPMATVAAVVRYHYAGQTLFAVALAIALASLVTSRRADAHAGGIAGAVVLLVALPLLLVPYTPDLHAEWRAKAAVGLARIDAAIAAVPPGEEVRIRNAAYGPMAPIVMMIGPEKMPGLAAAFVIHYPSDVVDGRRVRFVARNEAELDGAAPGGRLSRIFLPPGTPPTPAAPEQPGS